jgi:hypothetical protein
MRAMSDWMKDAETKAAMLKLAEEYEALADRADCPSFAASLGRYPPALTPI